MMKTYAAASLLLRFVGGTPHFLVRPRSNRQTGRPGLTIPSAVGVARLVRPARNNRLGIKSSFHSKENKKMKNHNSRIQLFGAIVAATTLSLTCGFAAPNPDRDAYFGETHVHTSWSLDAFAIGNILTTPGEAYKYFKGEPIKHPLGYEVKIDTPLDWAGVTDHSEYAGVVNLANEPGSAVSKIPEAEPLILKSKTKEEMERVALYAKIGRA